jgi:uncharacterized protein (TIGR02217 family)
MSFHEVQFPVTISNGSVGGPSWSTMVKELASGHEKRNANWANARHKYDAIHAVKSNTAMTEIVDFFNCRRGRAYGFRYKDWADYSATGQTLGTGDDLETDFQLVKIYTDSGGSWIRTITKPVDGTLTVYDDESEVDSEDYDIDLTTGIITFDTAPVTGHVITADFQFDVPCRFDIDYLPVSLDFTTFRSVVGSIPIIEDRITA